jgi:hypothetical protein
MDHRTERRRYVRIPVNIPAGVYVKDQPYDGIDAEILSISMGGAFVHCHSRVALGKEVLIEIRFAETRLLEAKVTDLKNDVPPAGTPEKSVVKWSSEDEAGFGVEFVDLSPENRRFLTKLVQYFENLAQAGVSFNEEDQGK